MKRDSKDIVIDIKQYKQNMTFTILLPFPRFLLMISD